MRLRDDEVREALLLVCRDYIGIERRVHADLFSQVQNRQRVGIHLLRRAGAEDEAIGVFDGEDGGLGGITFDEDAARFGTAEDVRVGWYDDAGDRVREELGFDMESQESV